MNGLFSSLARLARYVSSSAITGVHATPDTEFPVACVAASHLLVEPDGVWFLSLPLQSEPRPTVAPGWPHVERVGDQRPCPSMTAQPRGRRAKALLVDGSRRSNQPRSCPPKQPRHPSAGARPGRSHPSPPIASRVRGRSPITPWRLSRFLAAALPRRRPLVEDVPSLALECCQLEVHSRTLAARQGATA